ncbi:MAG: hypothetical protein ACKV2V_14650 [Blastocatellia bacterium]
MSLTSDMAIHATWRAMALALLLTCAASRGHAQTAPPVINSLTPNTAVAGSPGFSLAINGTGFSRVSVVRWNGATRVSALDLFTGNLVATIPATDIATPGAASVTIFTPDGTGGGPVSPPAIFTITAPNNPAPTLTSLTPPTVNAGAASLLLQVTGTNFIAGSVVRWNGADRPTTVLSPTQLSANIPGTDLANAGTASVTVFNPAPGGGLSNPLPINVINPAPFLIGVTPATITASAPNATLTLTGRGFAPSSVVNWNGAPRPTTFVSGTQLMATIPGTDLANAGTASVTVVTPAPGGGTTAALNVNIVNPTPAISILNPATAVAGNGAFTLQITGSGFIPASVIDWNGAPRATSYVSGTQLMAQITAADVQTAGTASVTAINPGPGGVNLTSAPAIFTIQRPVAVAPTLTSLTPNTATAGSPGLTLTLTGSNFIAGAIARWNGADRPTTMLSPTQLTAIIPASDLAQTGTASLTVFNPGGGLSNTLPLNIVNPAPVITSVTPNTLAAGAMNAMLTINGRGFASASIVQWNGAPRPTAFVSGAQLMAALTAADLAAAGTANVSVINPAPGGGTSTALPVSIVHPAPVLTSLFPNSIAAGSPGFTVQLTGSGFIPGSVAQWNGAPRPTTFLSATQLSAVITAQDARTVGTAAVSVINPAPGGGMTTTVPFTVLPRPLPPPVLQTVTAALVSQGARQTRLTIVGQNFRPGARLVIGPGAANPGLAPATDIAIESFSRMSDTLITAIISVSPRALAGPRAVDVINNDNSATTTRGSNTTQPLRVQQSNSLAAPVQVLNIAITHPRNGTVIAQGDRSNAEALLGGAGTGTITGHWLWDGAVTEQFAINITAGERVTLRTTQPLPTIFLGPHTLELRINHPNLIQSPPVNVVINPGNWKLMRLLAPNSGAGFSPRETPTLRWAIVPGAAKYQVGFSTDPYFRTVRQWLDVNDTQWQVPADVWAALPEGELYWTVRVIESSGVARVPALMRRIARVTPGALEPLPGEMKRAAGGSALIEWNALKSGALYRLSISRDAEGRDIVRRFLTTSPQTDLRSIHQKLDAGATYYWRVEAYSMTGRPIIAGNANAFIGRLARALGDTNWGVPGVGSPTPARKVARRLARPVEIASLALPALPAEAFEDVPDMEPDDETRESLQLVNRTPAPDQTVGDTRPQINLEFKTKVDTGDVLLVVDDTDTTAMAKISETAVSYKPIIPLNTGPHQVIVAAGAESAGWRFNVAANATGATQDTAASGTDAESEVARAASPATQGTATAQDATAEPAGNGNGFNAEAGSNTQLISGQEQDTNVISLAAQGTYREGPWSLEMNGSGLVNSILGPDPRHLNGQFNDYVFSLGHDTDNLKAKLRFGILVPALFSEAEFVSTAIPREGVEASLGTMAGTFAFYHNTNDKGRGEGIGFGFRQELRGASYQTPLFHNSDRIKLRLMWLGSRDIGRNPVKIGFDTSENPAGVPDPFALARAGDSYGALLIVRPGGDWQWTSEYSRSSNNLNRASAESVRQSGQAWRTGVTGSWKRFNASLAFRDVTPDFANPANATLTQLGQSDRRGLDAALSRDTKIGGFSATYQYLRNDYRLDDRAHLSLHNLNLNWTKSLTKTTTLSIGGNETRTMTANRRDPRLVERLIDGLADQRRVGFTTAVTQMIRTMSITVSGSRNWFRDRVNDRANNIVTSAGVNTSWMPKAWFQWNSNVSLNWTAGEKFSAGGMRMLSVYVQPTFTWKRADITITPLITINQMLGQMLRQTPAQTFDEITGELIDLPILPPELFVTANMWMAQYGGRVAWQLPGRLRFSTFSLEGSLARTQDMVSGNVIRTPRILFIWTIVKSGNRIR